VVAGALAAFDGSALGDPMLAEVTTFVCSKRRLALYDCRSREHFNPNVHLPKYL
jgi:hypothetical protein